MGVPCFGNIWNFDDAAESVTHFGRSRKTFRAKFFVEAGAPPPKVPAMPLHRSRQHQIIAGVCGGLADWLGWSPTMVRVLFVVASVLSAGFPGIIVYLVMWVLMPKAD